ncbi:hypothetical protein ST47_g3784 [Ascochyta rabiei]|uniref:Uncharacterized protein n=1 Tax=Didymella rabiei TaxID=5454 RepID=A0A163GXX5_DIDRA|nr:hypothetical protein ST47_g3784 [Ascochyta rabiei]
MCGVVVTYTHKGYNSIINTIVWLFTAKHWSGQFLGAGRGEWVTGADNTSLAWAASEGFAAATADGGHAADAAIED